MNWNYFLDQLKTANEVDQYTVAKQTDEEVIDFLLMNLALAYVLMARSDPERPEFFPCANMVLNHSATNPDNAAYCAIIDGNNQYRISGYRGTVHTIEFQVGHNWQGYAETMGGSTQTVKINELNVEQDGYFEILLSQEKPKHHKGNWIKLEENSNYVVVRQTGYKPDEQNARIAIENLSPLSSRRRSPLDQKAFQKIINFVKYNANSSLGFLKDVADEAVVNTFKNYDWSAIGGVKSQVYQQGIYDIPKDQAMILTYKVPDTCTYWNIQTSDFLWQTPDAVYAQTYLSGHIDRSDADGLTRLVLSHSDPGVANWVDLYDIEEGYILVRWLECGDAPLPDIKIVALEDLEKHLPKDTKLVTPEQRALSIRENAVAKQLRRDW